MVSAHWETPGTFMVMSTPKPPMVYDYYGFPAHTYEIQYPAPGAPALADRVQQLLQTAGLPIVQDSQRGFDHGAFVPAYVMYPDADVPMRSEEHTSELQSLMRISYAVFCLKKKNNNTSNRP